MSFRSHRWNWNNDALAIFIAGLIGVIIGCAVFMGVVWILWLCWGAVIPEIWPNGPYAVKYLGYWQFLAGWVILAALIKLLRGRSK